MIIASGADRQMQATSAPHSMQQHCGETNTLPEPGGPQQRPQPAVNGQAFLQCCWSKISGGCALQTCSYVVASDAGAHLNWSKNCSAKGSMGRHATIGTLSCSSCPSRRPAPLSPSPRKIALLRVLLQWSRACMQTPSRISHWAATSQLHDFPKACRGLATMTATPAICWSHGHSK